MDLEIFSVYLFLVVVFCTAWGVFCCWNDISSGWQLIGHIAVVGYLSWMACPSVGV